MSSKRTLFLVEVAIFTALALLLDIIPFLAFKVWPNGGSVSFAMIPIFIVAFRWGLKGGLTAGLLWGLLQLVIEPVVVHPLQGFIEYGFAFTALGLAGIFAKPVQQALKDGKLAKRFIYIMLGVLLGTFLRFLAHFYAGIVFFGHYAPEDQPVWLYSLLYNGSYMLPAFVLSTVVVFFLFIKQPRTLLQTAS
ncbi:energy-coupled thiamine transporter ThiT [Ornithinibacillus halophilus]|uniref:Thiamine transporter n=1 Tax=Ornithinibacillus halophilus TaxID=930117 RepID=A0A1M5NRZ5_9BACI|nr:energy-coupled thiamine transporter ThiT [Ornithinibacillus halophilus]SHG92215.1 thiamine transporter [Ornithinibacillus halophilus]